ncbi:caspase, EACC1-associated type [Micromonospora arida]
MSDMPLDHILKATVILIGASRFPRDRESLRDLPGVVANIVDFERLILETKYIGVDADRVTRILDEEPPHVVLERIADLAADAADTLVIYYAGHGILADDGELLLTGAQSTYRLAAANSMRWETLKSTILKSPAPRKLVILDCCFSGRAIGMSVDEAAVLGQLDISGTVVITASPKNSIALAPLKSRRTTFTDGLLSVIEKGIPGAGATLDIEDLFTECKRRMQAIQAPQPEILATGAAAKLPLCRNVSEVGAFQRELPAPTSAAAQRRGLSLDTLAAVHAGITFRETSVWRRDLTPSRFAENVATIITASSEEVNPSPDEIAVTYAAILLVQMRLDQVIEALPSIMSMRENNSWPRDFIAVQAVTERLVERCADPSSPEQVRSALGEWVAGYALSTTTSEWQNQEVAAAASRLANVFTSNIQEAQELAEFLVVEAERIQRSAFPSRALSDSWAYTSSASGRVEYLRSHMVYELGIVLREMHFDVYRHGRELIEQIGIVETFGIDALGRDLDGMRWALAENGDVVLVAKCFDPAVEEALRSYVERFRQVQEALPDTPSGLNIRRYVVRAATADGVGPRQVDGRPAYRRPITRLTMNSNKIRQLLMGEQLYGQPRLAMRELYQNSLDACRYRELRQAYLSRRGVLAPSWTPTVKFQSVYSDSGSLLRLDCTDNGVGMQEGVLESCFLNAGARFVETASFAEEQALWLELDQQLRLTPNSTFGIGAFSYFMLADAVEVLTRPQNPDGSLGEGLRLLINAGSAVARVVADDTVSVILPEGGTAVRLYLRPEYRSLSRLQLRNFLDETILFAPVRLEVSEGNESVVREPGELSTESPSSRSVAWIDGESRAWWTARTAPVLADGIRTPSELVGTMATLHGDHKPVLRVDRNNLVQWDADWVLAKAAESAEALAGWEGLSLRWLWDFSEAYPKYGKLLFERVQRIRPIMPLGQSKHWGREVDTRMVGCFPGDRYLIRELQDRLETRYPAFLVPEARRRKDRFLSLNVRFPACLRPWRRRVWLECLPGLFESWTQSNTDVGLALIETVATPEEDRFPVWEPETLQGIDHPDSVDAALLASQPDILSTSFLVGGGAGQSSMVDVVALIHGAERTGVSLGEAIARLSKFARFALVGVPAVARDSLGYVPNKRDCHLVTALGEAWTVDRKISAEDFLGLVPVCQELSVSLQEACESLESLLRRLGATPPAVTEALGKSAMHVPSAREVRFFGFGEYDQGRELRYGRGTRAALMRAAWRADMGQREIANAIERYAPFGMLRYVRLQESVRLPTTDNTVLAGWSANFDERQPWIDEEVFRRGFISDRPSSPDELLGHALFFAALQELDLAEATRMVASFPGLTDEQREMANRTVPSIVPTELDLKLMRNRVGDTATYQDKILSGIGQRSLVRRRMSPLELQLASQGENVSLQFVFDRLKHFEHLGVKLPDCDAATLEGHEFTDLEMELLTTEDWALGAFGDFPHEREKKPIVVPIPPKHVMVVGAAERVELGTVTDVLDGLAHLGVVSGCAPLPDALRTYIPTRGDIAMAHRFAGEPIGMAICRAAQEQQHSIGYVVDSVSPWVAWFLNLPAEKCASALDGVRDLCGDIVPSYSDVSFYCAVSGHATAAGSRLGRLEALFLAAQANISVRAVIDRFSMFEPLLSMDQIVEDGLRSCPDDMAAVVPDSLWVLAAAARAVVGRSADECRNWLGVTDELRTAARRFAE